MTISLVSFRIYLHLGSFELVPRVFLYALALLDKVITILHLGGVELYSRLTH